MPRERRRQGVDIQPPNHPGSVKIAWRPVELLKPLPSAVRAAQAAINKRAAARAARPPVSPRVVRVPKRSGPVRLMAAASPAAPRPTQRVMGRDEALRFLSSRPSEEEAAKSIPPHSQPQGSGGFEELSAELIRKHGNAPVGLKVLLQLLEAVTDGVGKSIAGMFENHKTAIEKLDAKAERAFENHAAAIEKLKAEVASLKRKVERHVQ